MNKAMKEMQEKRKLNPVQRIDKTKTNTELVRLSKAGLAKKYEEISHKLDMARKDPECPAKTIARLQEIYDGLKKYSL